jgi:prevent-host-death family protein
MQISVRELKNHLSQILASARQGEEVSVTSHRRVIARIVGVPDEAVVAGIGGLTAEQRSALLELVAEGASWQGGKPRGGRGHTVIEGRTLAEMVLEDRG